MFKGTRLNTIHKDYSHSIFLQRQGTRHNRPGTTSKQRNNHTESHSGERKQSCTLRACATAPELSPYYSWQAPPDHGDSRLYAGGTLAGSFHRLSAISKGDVQIHEDLQTASQF